MINNNKILTVSYGTFSCTLEGFDDSFETMKAIAEYFRDLAADDRYFGAEPPQPDAELLARIAEKEMSRRVEGSTHEGRILLKAHDAPVAESETAQDASQPPTPAAPPVAASAPPSPTAVAEHTPVAEPDPAPQDPALPAAASEPAPQAPASPADEPGPETAQPFAIDTAHSAPVGAETPAGADDFFAAGVPAPAAGGTEDRDDFSRESPAPAHLAGTSASTPGADSIADRLARIRAVVSRQVIVTGPAGDYDEEESVPAAAPAPGFDEMDAPGGPGPAEEDEVEGTEHPLSDVARDIESALDEDDRIDAEAEEEDAPGEDDLSTVLSRIEADNSSGSAQDEEAAEETDVLFTAPFFKTADEAPVCDDYDEDAFASHVSDEQVTEESDAVAPEPDTAEDDGIDAGEDLILTEQELVADESAEAPEDTAGEAHPEGEILSAENDDVPVDGSADAPDGDYSLLARSGDVKADDEALEDETPGDDTAGESASEEVITEDEIPEDETDTGETIQRGAGSFDGREALETDDDDEPVPGVTGRVMKVSADELEDALEAGELEELDDVPETVHGHEENAGPSEEKTPQAGRDTLPNVSGVSGEDVTRLMAEADQHMEEPEGATRRSAFAHLRAAVAARFADKTIDKESENEESAEAYRSDLAEVVRPRRPVTGGHGTNRPADKTAAPLKLVAEQRVDANYASRPVAPRRIAATVQDDEDTDGDTGFAAFASEMGATSLPDLLEAAAAYMSFVEGQEDFSRPQLMTRVRQASEGSEFTREDGLRSFGQLLRSGKIEKMKGGRFAASEDIGFKPDERAAG